MLIIPLAILVVTNLRPFPPNDFWWHLKAGETIVETNRIPSVDEFSFTMAGKPYDNYAQFWLSESLLYVLYRLGGLQLLVFAHSLAIALAYLLLFSACRVFAGPRTSVAGILFAAGLGFPNWTLRPQGFVLPLASAVLWCVVQDLAGRNRKSLLAIPLIMLLWANSHGSWVIGALLLVIYLVARLARAIVRPRFAQEMGLPALVAFAGLATVLMNPRGPRILLYVAAMAGDPVSQTFGTEWIPAAFGNQVGGMFLVGFLLSSLLLMVSPRRPNFFELLTYLVFGLLAFKMIRAILWFGIAMAPAVAAHTAAVFTAIRSMMVRPARAATLPIRHGLNLAILATLLMVVAMSTPWLKTVLPLPQAYRGLVSNETPVAAVEFMLQHPLGANVFSEQGFGSYLIWAASPQYRVYVDTRFELYTLELFKEYFKVSNADLGWEDALVSHNVDTLLLSPEIQPELIRAAAQSSSWRRLYGDDQAVVFERRG